MPKPPIPPTSASASRQINAVVVSSGLMAKTVKARVGVQKWNNHIQKHFNLSTNHLVHDPNSSLRTGDVISISSGWRVSRRVHHVVNHIIAPWGEPISARPEVPSAEGRIRERIWRKTCKDEMRRLKREEEGAGWTAMVGEDGADGEGRWKAWKEGKRADLGLGPLGEGGEEGRLLVEQDEGMEKKEKVKKTAKGEGKDQGKVKARAKANAEVEKLEPVTAS